MGKTETLGKPKTVGINRHVPWTCTLRQTAVNGSSRLSQPLPRASREVTALPSLPRGGLIAHRKMPPCIGRPSPVVGRPLPVTAVEGLFAESSVLAHGKMPHVACSYAVRWPQRPCQAAGHWLQRPGQAHVARFR